MRVAAGNIRDIKRRIKSVTSTEHITNAMKLVSAGKLRKAKAIFEKTNENSHYITHTISEIFNNSKDIPEEYLEGTRDIVKNLLYRCNQQQRTLRRVQQQHPQGSAVYDRHERKRIGDPGHRNEGQGIL